MIARKDETEEKKMACDKEEGRDSRRMSITRNIPQWSCRLLITPHSGLMVCLVEEVDSRNPWPTIEPGTGTNQVKTPFVVLGS